MLQNAKMKASCWHKHIPGPPSAWWQRKHPCKMSLATTFEQCPCLRQRLLPSNDSALHLLAPCACSNSHLGCPCPFTISAAADVDSCNYQETNSQKEQGTRFAYLKLASDGMSHLFKTSVAGVGMSSTVTASSGQYETAASADELLLRDYLESSKTAVSATTFIPEDAPDAIWCS